MGLFDGPTWRDRILYEQQEQTDTQRRQERQAEQANTARAREAKKAAKQQSSAHRESVAQHEVHHAELMNVLSGMHRAQRADASRAHELHERQISLQQKAHWATFRQTADGAAWWTWIQQAYAFIDLVHACNDLWRDAYAQAKHRVITGDLKAHAEYGVYLPPDHPFYPVKGNAKKLPAKAAGQLAAKTIWQEFRGEGKRPDPYLTVQDWLQRRRPELAEENAYYRQTVTTYVTQHLGVDLLHRPGASLPGWGVDDQNWNVRDRIEDIVRYAYTELPPASAVPELPSLQVRVPDEFYAAELSGYLAALHSKTGGVVTTG